MLTPSELRPAIQPLAPLFAAVGATPADEARRLAAVARSVIDGDDPDSAIEHAWYAVDGAARAALDLAAAGIVPLAAVEVAAGLTAVARPKDYGVKAIWSLAWELWRLATGEETLLDEDALEIVASMEAACGPEAARVLRERFADAEREERAVRARSGDGAGDAGDAGDGGDGADGAAPATRETREAPIDERAAMAFRIALIGAGGSSRADLAEARPQLWDHRDQAGGPWEALCRAFDVVGAGSFASLDRLGALAEAASGSPSVVWLDEVACRVAREAGRAARRAEALDAMLGAEAFGRNAVSLALSVSLGRKALSEHGDRAHDAWLRLAATRRADPPRAPEIGENLPPGERAALRRAARRGDGIARLLLDMEQEHAALGQVQRDGAEREGPFYGLRDVPREVDTVLDDVAHKMLLGFRELYGMELLREALPRLEQGLAAPERPERP